MSKSKHQTHFKVASTSPAIASKSQEAFASESLEYFEETFPRCLWYMRPHKQLNSLKILKKCYLGTAGRAIVNSNLQLHYIVLLSKGIPALYISLLISVAILCKNFTLTI